MNDTPKTKQPHWKDWGVILVIMAATTFAGLLVAKSAAPNAPISAALVVTAGTAALAVLTWRYTRLPRWAYATSVLLLGASAVASAWLMPQEHSVRDMLWMHPWYFISLTSAGYGPRGVLCCGSSVTSGWLLVAGALAIAIVPAIIAILP